MRVITIEEHGITRPVLSGVFDRYPASASTSSAPTG
jgi:hypothetical protein